MLTPNRAGWWWARMPESEVWHMVSVGGEPPFFTLYRGKDQEHEPVYDSWRYIPDPNDEPPAYDPKLGGIVFTPPDSPTPSEPVVSMDEEGDTIVSSHPLTLTDHDISVALTLVEEWARKYLKWSESKGIRDNFGDIAAYCRVADKWTNEHK